MFIQFWNWLKDNDAPNWIVLAFSLIAWPAVIYWWSTRKRQNIPHLEVISRKSETGINGQIFPAVELIFANRTGRVVYLSRARLRECQKSFPIPSAAAKYISGGWRELKFQWSDPSKMVDHVCILQTNENVITSIAVTNQMDQDFDSYRPNWLRRRLRWPKYFLLQYTAMVGEQKYSVETVY